jgi:superfamily I DNA/RNA helicase
VGELVRCNGNVATLRNDMGEGIAHVRSHYGRELQVMDGLDGKHCAFAVGGSPVRYREGKPWEHAVVQWILLDTLEEGLTPGGYTEARRAELAALERARLLDLLMAKWYVTAWEQKTGEKPKAPLHADDVLDGALHEALASCSQLEELVRLLGAICTSPYYAIDAAGRRKACKRFLHPAKWDSRVFMPNRPPEECRFYAEVWPLCGVVIQKHMDRARTVAIDLEAEGPRIWEFGWRNAAGVGLKSAENDLSDTDLQAALQESLLFLQAPCIVGHNLLNWDLVRLQERHVSFPERSELWDTLIAAWMLEPWKPSHALIVKEDAHRADADAKRTYEVFEEQVRRLAPCLDGHQRDIRKLVDELFDGRTKLSAIRDRQYPSDLQKKTGASTLYPRNRMRDVAWQRYCLVEHITPEARLRDPVMSPDICSRLAREAGDIRVKAASVIVSDAAANRVQVRLSMLPAWLVDDAARARLHDAHAGQEAVRGDDTWHRVYIAEDLFSQPLDVSSGVIRDQKLVPAYAFEVVQAWQTAYARDLSEEDAKTAFPEAVEGRTGRAMLAVREKTQVPAWLLYEPPGIGEPGASWHLLAPIPHGMGIADAKPSGQDLKSWIALPRWKDGAVSSLDVDRLFVTPDTANRKLYLADIAHSALNLLNALPEEQILVCAMRWPSEAAELQRCLTQLSLSVLHADSPLRQIERLRKEGLRAIACSHAELPRYVEAARNVGQGIRVSLDEVPLHAWYAMLHAPEDSSRASVQEDGTANGQDKAVQITLKGRDIQEGVSIFLVDWVGALLRSDSAPDTPVLILDARLSNQPASRMIGVPRENLSFYPLEELLDEQRREVYHQVCFPYRPDDEIPNDYEAYRAFLRENWKPYDDFLPGTQRPAIEALVSSRKDLLLRLPTGAGKSEVFQVPALLRAHYSGRLSVVITPLRALMQDQVHRLWGRHFRESVDFLSGGREAWVNYDVYQGVLDGRIKLLYVAPERFRVPRFTEALERRRRMDGGLEFLVFDEVHCVSEWGFEFRPDYLFAAQYAGEWFRDKELPGNPHRLLLTSATVTRRNQQDLERELGLRPGEYDDLPKDMPHPIQPFIVLESCDLPESEEPAADDKFKKVLEILAKLDLARSAALIFVRKREDCHRISEALNSYAATPESSLARLHSLPFHAGMPESVKKEAVELLRTKTVNVLVCTKAFGMGMDIRHFHACVHYRPPTFIEDYLQEVGRIGRGEEERETAMKATGGQVIATLLFNHDNLEQNLGLLHDKAVKPPDLQDFFGYCVQHAVPFKQVGKAVCILPAAVRINEAKSFDENQVTNCLFWLERMGILKVEGRHPPFLDLTLRLGALRQIAAGDTASAVVARALLGLLDETTRVVVDQSSAESSGADRQAAESAFGRFIRGLVRGVLALISPPSDPPEKEEPPPTRVARTAAQPSSQDQVTVSVSMQEVMAASGGLSADDLHTLLIELHQARALSFQKTLVMMRAAVPSTDTFWDLLQYAVDRLMRPTGGGVELLPRKAFEEELKKWYRDFLTRAAPAEEPADTGKPTNRIADATHKRRIQREVYRAMGTAMKTVRYAGLQMKESLSKEGTTQYARAVPVASVADVQRGIRDRLEAVKKLVGELRDRDPQAGGGKVATLEVGLVDIVHALGQETRLSRLRELMNLVEASGFYGLENATDEWVTVVSLNSLQPLPTHEPEVPGVSPAAEKTIPEGSQKIQTTYAEMLEKHELQVLRAQCMVLFAAMPTENRKQFIDRYFQCLTAKDLQGALEDAVGEVGDEVLAGNQMLQGLLVQVRRERFGKEIKRMNDAQRDVCTAPFTRKLLVNAGPGSGKTHVLMMRCAHLIHAQNIKPSEILVLAFNRAVVFEIRDRIRDLFRELGYGSHVRRLDVSTFHSFALRHQQTSDMYEEDAIGEAVHRFAGAVAGDDALARRIAGGYKAILVDEFQDMNEDFYAVVQSLVTNCQGGAMVIGDDDQDILTWNRNKWREKHRINCPLEAVHYFKLYRTTFAPEEHALPLNYRSVPEIVARANGMIAKGSKRLKFSRMKAEMELAAVRTESGAVTLPFDAGTLGDVVRDSMERRTADGKSESVAILCRSNRECRQVCERLVAKERVAPDRLDLLGSEDFALYQLRPTGALMDLCAKRDEWDFVEPYVWDELLGEYAQLKHADASRGTEDLKVMYELIRMERGRPRMRDVVDFVQEMRSSDVERLKAKTGLGVKPSKITVSTVHKVKGLEYDTVVVMPSSERFPLNDSDGSQASSTDAAEEARLCYVGMTRARNRLYVGWPEGGRERAWWSGLPFAGMGRDGFNSPKGSPREVVVRWSGRTENVDRDIQGYIEKQVNTGDRITLRNRDMCHNGRQVGVLTRMPPQTTALRVSTVMRYSCGNYFRAHKREYWNELHPTVQQQKWFYVVLAEAR